MRRWLLVPLLVLAGCGEPKVVFENSTTVPMRMDNGVMVVADEPTRNIAP
jgi:hypothetical protein